MGKRAFVLGFLMAGLLAVAGVAQAATLTTVTPDSGTFLGGTPVVLSGNFTVTGNTAPVTTYQVVFSANATLGGEDDVTATVVSSSSTNILITTPGVSAPGIFNVFVSATRGGVTQTSNSQPYEYLGENDVTPIQSTATSLSENFDFVDEDGDGLISDEEAEAFGITQAQFDEIDANGDGQLSQAELNDIINPGCGPFNGLAGLVILGILGFLLSIWDGLRSFFVNFPGNPGQPNDGSADELENP